MASQASEARKWKIVKNFSIMLKKFRKLHCAAINLAGKLQKKILFIAARFGQLLAVAVVAGRAMNLWQGGVRGGARCE